MAKFKNKYKTEIISLLVAILIIFASNTDNLEAQLVIDAGPDIVICTDQWQIFPDTIGGNPTATGGNPEYTYAWLAVLDTGFLSFHYYYTASFFLDDTTKANPIVVNTLPTLIAGNSLNFKVTVSDDDTNIAEDSMNVVFSKAVISDYSLSYSIHIGDSVPIDAAGFLSMNLPIEQYLWEPGKYLVDSTASSTWTKPEKDIDYSLTIIDTGGCRISDGPFYRIHILPNSHQELFSHEDLKVYPNPIRKESIIMIPNYYYGSNYLIEFVDSNGKQILLDNLNSVTYPLNFIEKAGIYYFIIYRDSKMEYTGSFIKN